MELGSRENSTSHKKRKQARKPVMSESCLPLSSRPPPAAGMPVPATNRLISMVFSGPTLNYVQSALSAALSNRNPVTEAPNGSRQDLHCLPPRMMPTAEKVVVMMNKMDKKQTLRVMSPACSGGAPADDGYKWRKYGQKSIKNSPNPRSYYRCTNLRCNAKKQVERSKDDPEILIITYEGLHLHNAYSNLLASATPALEESSVTVRSNNTTVDHLASKKPKLVQPVEISNARLTTENTESRTGDLWEYYSCNSRLDWEENVTEGLLEDVVPLMVRKP